MNLKNLTIFYRRNEFDTWSYHLEINKKTMMSSSRTFLCKHEAEIESEWLFGKFGVFFRTSPKETENA